MEALARMARKRIREGVNWTSLRAFLCECSMSIQIQSLSNSINPMIILRGRWNRVARKALADLKETFPDLQIEFTPCNSNHYQLLINRRLMAKLPTLDITIIIQTINKFITGKKVIQRNIRSVQRSRNLVKGVQSLLTTFIRQRPISQSQLAQQLLDSCQVKPSEKRLVSLQENQGIQSIRSSLRTAMSLFKIKRNEELQPVSSKGSSSIESIRLSQKDGFDFPSTFTRVPSLQHVPELKKLRILSRSEHKLSYQSNGRRHSMPCLEVIGLGEGSEFQMSVDEKLIEKLRCDEEGEEFVDTEMEQIIPNYKQLYYEKDGLKLFRKRLYESSFNILEFEDVAFSLQAIKQINLKIIKTLLTAFSEPGNWYDIKLFQLSGPKVIRVDSHIPLEYSYKKVQHYQHWPILIQKALLKSIGSTDQLRNYHPERIMKMLTGGMVQYSPIQKLLGDFRALSARGYKIVLRRDSKAIMVKKLQFLRGKGGVARVMTLTQNGHTFKMNFNQIATMFSFYYKVFWDQHYIRQSRTILISRNRHILDLHHHSPSLLFLECLSTHFFRFQIKLFQPRNSREYVLIDKAGSEEYLSFEIMSSGNIMLVIECPELKKGESRELLLSSYSEGGISCVQDELDVKGFSVGKNYYMGLFSKQTPWHTPIKKTTKHHRKSKQFLSDS